MRTKIEERCNFTTEDKQKILAKSAGRCAKCGISLTEKTATVEHVIPLDKGGSNEFSNLVALCKKCNEFKDNLVVKPDEYYGYVNPEVKEELKTAYKTYCENVSWLSLKNFTREDKTAFYYEINTPGFEGHIKKARAKDMLLTMRTRGTAVFQKAGYSDLEEIQNYVQKYHKKYSLSVDNLKDCISDTFMHGALYTLKKGTEIIAVFPLSIKHSNINGRICYTLNYCGIPVLYPKEEYLQLLTDCIGYINSGLAFANPQGLIVYTITFPMQDKFLDELLNRLSRYGASFESNPDEEGWKEIVFDQFFQQYEGQEAPESNSNDNLQFFSDFVEEIFQIKKKATITKISRKPRKKPTENIKKLQKERRRIARDFDEYDEEYYM